MDHQRPRNADPTLHLAEEIDEAAAALSRILKFRADLDESNDNGVEYITSMAMRLEERLEALKARRASQTNNVYQELDP